MEKQKDIQSRIREYFQNLEDRRKRERSTRKVLTKVVIGAPGIEVMQNNATTLVKPLAWLKSFLIAIYNFSRNKKASVVSSTILAVPLYEGTVKAATKTKVPNARQKIGFLENKKT